MNFSWNLSSVGPILCSENKSMFKFFESIFRVDWPKFFLDLINVKVPQLKLESAKIKRINIYISQL